ncbi:MAG TPA: DUF4157 domain-containing protein [Flavipsychrobacter sp.]|nr:DUF4157 domain-containing protein [Flavipsychrobacter sp.]
MFSQQKIKSVTSAVPPVAVANEKSTPSVQPATTPKDYQFSKLPLHALNKAGDTGEQQANAVAKTVTAGKETTTLKDTKPASGLKVDNALDKQIRSKQGTGMTLDAETEAGMSQRLGFDFSQVKIHADAKAAALTEQVHAKAFTQGNDIFFNEGEYDPVSTEGKQLLAHELTHVAQQEAGTPGIHRKEKKEIENLTDIGEADRLEMEREKKPVEASLVEPAKLTGLFATDPKLAGGATESIGAPGDTVKFSSNIKTLTATKGFDIQRGLTSVAGLLHGRASALPLNTSTSIELDLTAFGGSKSIFRFSYYDKTEGKATSEEVLVEMLSTTATASKSTMPTSSKDFGIGKRKFTLESGWAQEEYDQLVQALNMIPDSGLQNIDGIRFKRSADKADDAEAGHYSQDDNSITIRNKAFNNNPVRYGSYKPAVQVIVHEVGHAIDFYTVNKAWAQYEKDGNEKNLEKESTLSGQQWRKNDAGDFELRDTGIQTDFRKAVKKDKGSKSITGYGNTDTLENFAEAFSMYITDADLLKALRPNTYDFFRKRYNP